MIPLSDNHFSVDNQIDSCVTYLNHAPEMVAARVQFKHTFPEYDRLVWQDGGSWIDAEASQVDPEFMSWVADWIENHTPIFWEEGEPWLPDNGYDGDDPEPTNRPDLARNWFDHVEQGGA